jgi:hypothetical protein
MIFNYYQLEARGLDFATRNFVAEVIVMSSLPSRLPPGRPDRQAICPGKLQTLTGPELQLATNWRALAAPGSRRLACSASPKWRTRPRIYGPLSILL